MSAGRVLFLFLILTFPLFVAAQPEALTSSNSVFQVAFDSAIATSNRNQLPVYTGREYYPYFIKQWGQYGALMATAPGSRPGEHPFYLSDEFRPEKIEFDGSVYRAINLAFDICRNEVVVLSPKRKALILPEGKVKTFTYAGHTFRALSTNGLTPGFYDVMVWKDSASLVVKRWKKQSELWHVISDYYVIKGDQAYPVSLVSVKSVGVKAAVLRIFNDRRDDVRSYIRQNRLKFSKNKKEQSLVKVVEYYASLKAK